MVAQGGLRLSLKRHGVYISLYRWGYRNFRKKEWREVAPSYEVMHQASSSKR